MGCDDGCSESPCDSLLAVASAKLFKANAANVSKGELKAEVSTSGCPSSMCPGQSGACHPCEGADGYCYPYDCDDGCSESPCEMRQMSPRASSRRRCRPAVA